MSSRLNPAEDTVDVLEEEEEERLSYLIHMSHKVSNLQFNP